MGTGAPQPRVLPDSSSVDARQGMHDHAGPQKLTFFDGPAVAASSESSSSSRPRFAPHATAALVEPCAASWIGRLVDAGGGMARLHSFTPPSVERTPSLLTTLSASGGSESSQGRVPSTLSPSSGWVLSAAALSSPPSVTQCIGAREQPPGSWEEERVAEIWVLLREGAEMASTWGSTSTSAEDGEY